jgi:hypothetical protein
MIDHLLLAEELMPFVTRAFICHTVSLDTSDHYAVVVDLRLPSNGSQDGAAAAASADK